MQKLSKIWLSWITVQHYSKSEVLSNHKYFIAKCGCDYYKMQQLSYYKLRQKFVTKCVRFFVTKCDSFITICDSYYKMCELCYNMQQLLQIAKFIKTCVGTFSHMLPVFCSVSAEVFIFSVSASGTAVVIFFFIFQLMFFFQITHLTFVD